MRFTMGAWIDGLTDDERDLLVTARAMNDGTDWWDYETQCGCLTGTVRMPRSGSVDIERHNRALMMWTSGEDSQLDVPWAAAPASIRYPQAVKRFGINRVVRAVKLRAARGNSVPAPARETVGAAS